MRTIVVVQCRFQSSRLPGKAVAPLAGRPLIAHVLERALAIRADGVVLATTDQPSDDLVADAGAHAGVQVVRGDERDVLRRIKIAAALAQAEAIVRVTGDCPLFAPDVANAVLRHFWRFRDDAQIDYCWNDTRCSGFPDGTDVEVMTYDALALADRCAGDPGDREHVTKWIRRRLKVGTVLCSHDYSALKLSVDTADDLDRVRRIAAHLPVGALDLNATVLAAAKAGFWTAAGV